MAKNFVQHGLTVSLMAVAGGVVSGNLYLIGGLPVVASFSAVEGDHFEAHTGGVWDFTTKVAGDEPAEGEAAYLTPTGTLTVAATVGNVRVGVFLSSDGNGSDNCRVRLDGVSTTPVTG